MAIPLDLLIFLLLCQVSSHLRLLIFFIKALVFCQLLVREQTIFEVHLGNLTLVITVLLWFCLVLHKFDDHAGLLAVR